MKVIASAIRFFVYSNLFISFCIAAYTAKTSLLIYGNNGNLHVNLIAFGATLLFYCFHRINKKSFLISGETGEARNSWMSTHKSTYYFLIVISTVLLSSQMLYMPLKTWLIFIPVGILGVGYTFPIIPTNKGFKRLRDIAWSKTIWIAFALGWLTTFLPVIFIEPIGSIFKTPALFTFLRTFLFLFAICIPFDIRDMHFDKQRGVNTLPVNTGATTSIYIAIALLLFFTMLVCVQFFYFDLNSKAAYALLLSAAITILSLLPLLKNTHKHALFFPIVYDGAMLLQWVLVLGFTYAR